MIIDAHLHFPPVEKGGSLAQSKGSLIRDMDSHGIDYAFVIPDNVPDSPIGSLDDSLGLVSEDDRLFLIGTINIEKDSKDHLEKLDFLFKNRQIIGMKIFPGHDPVYPTDRRLMPVYELCAEHDAPIVIHTGWNSNHPEAAKYNDPELIVEVAKKFPRLKIVIAHYFWPGVEYCYDITRGFKNIFFDTSALADREVMDETGCGAIKDILERTVRDNPASVLFGTDYAMCEFSDHIELIESLDISEENKKGIFYKNASQLFNLGL